MNLKKIRFAPALLKCRHWIFVATLLGLLLAASACHSPQPPLGPGEMQTGWGEAVFQMECAQCHNPNRIEPLSVSQLVSYRNAENLFLYIREAMPPHNPGSLPDYDYWAVTAYLLTLADAPMSGQTVLGPEIASEIGFE